MNWINEHDVERDKQKTHHTCSQMFENNSRKSKYFILLYYNLHDESCTSCWWATLLNGVKHNVNRNTNTGPVEKSVLPIFYYCSFNCTGPVTILLQKFSSLMYNLFWTGKTLNFPVAIHCCGCYLFICLWFRCTRMYTTQHNTTQHILLHFHTSC